MFSIRFAAVVPIFILVAGTAWGVPSPDGKRLIQTADDTSAWMSEDEISSLALSIHQNGGHCGGFMDVTDHRGKRFQPVSPLPLLEKREPTQGNWLAHILPELSADRIFQDIAKLSSFKNRYYQSESGANAATWIHDQFVTLARGRTDVTVELFAHSFKQPSVIVTLAGKGPQAQELVILGAHEDSINWSFGAALPNASAPGADDDASGVATLLETFRVLMDSGFTNSRTIVFMAFAGEERGLLGSQDIAQKYLKDGRLVAGVLQLDMTAYPGDPQSGQIPQIAMISDHVDPALTKFTEALIDTYVKVPWTEDRCGYACSDHASWLEAGYPSVFPFEAPSSRGNPKIHTEEDTLANALDASFGLHFAKLATAFAVELSSGD